MFKHYVKTAFKVFRRRKFFTFVSLFGITLTLTVLMIATAIIDFILGSAPPATRHDRTLFVTRLVATGEGSFSKGPPGYDILDRTVRGLPSAERVSIFDLGNTVTSFRDDIRLDLRMKRTDGQFWQILDFEFLEGGPFTDDDEAAGRHVAVITAAARDKLLSPLDPPKGTQLLSGAGPAVGRSIVVNQQRFEVVGVVKDVSRLSAMAYAEVWTPLSTAPSKENRKYIVGGFSAVVLAPDQARMLAIDAELQSRLADFELPEPHTRIICHAETMFDAMARQIIGGDGAGDGQGWAALLRLVMIVAVVLFMLLPTVNLANLNTSRILERASEIGVRRAFGASKTTLLLQFVVENVLLTLVGAAVSLLLSGAILHLLTSTGVAPYADFSLNIRTLACGVAIALFFGVFSGAYPAWRMSKLNPIAALGGRSSC